MALLLALLTNGGLLRSGGALRKPGEILVAVSGESDGIVSLGVADGLNGRRHAPAVHFGMAVSKGKSCAAIMGRTGQPP